MDRRLRHHLSVWHSTLYTNRWLTAVIREKLTLDNQVPTVLPKERSGPICSVLRLETQVLIDKAAV